MYTEYKVKDMFIECVCVSQERTVVCLYVCVQCLARLSHLSHDALSLVSERECVHVYVVYEDTHL